METDGNGTEPKPWLATSMTSAAHQSCDIYQAVHASDFLGTLQLFANEVNGLRASQGNPGGLPMVSQYGGTIPWASGSPQEVEETTAFYLMFNTGPQAVTYSVACPQETEQALLQPDTFWPLLFKTDQLCFAKAEC